MKTHKPVSVFNPNSLAPEIFKNLDEAFYIDMPCILAVNHLVKVNDIYYLLETLNNGEVIVRNVKFWNAEKKGFNITIIVLDLESGEIIKCSHRAKNDMLPCSWLLIASDYLFPESEDEKTIRDYCDGD